MMDWIMFKMGTYFYMLGLAMAQGDSVSQQLLNFKKTHLKPIGTLTTSAGSPVFDADLDTLNLNLIDDEYFMDTMTHFVRERIVERVVHAKGAGAFGYFEVTHDISNICKAKLFSKIGKRTPIAIRFSPTFSERGSADTILNPIGFAVKFYTEDGNFDIVGFNTPVFSIIDPVHIASLVHSAGRNPATNIRDPSMFWDFATLRPQNLHILMYLFAGFGTPNTFRHMPGFSIHTYQVYNEDRESYFVRFHFIPTAGIKNLNLTEATRLAGVDPDYNIRDLYNSIANGSLAKWDVNVQILTKRDVKMAPFDVFDVTKMLPTEDYPLKSLGKLVLNRNPENYLRDVEQLAFCPGNLIPGILGAPDKVFQARRFAYRDAQNHRLGINAKNIHVNLPLNKVLNYNRDGIAPVLRNMGDGPNYYNNSFNGPIPCPEEYRPRLLQIQQEEPDNFDQASLLWTEGFTDEQRNAMIASISNNLSGANSFIQKRTVKIFSQIHEDIGNRLAKALTSLQAN